ncbi:hypothetical protein LOZ57_005392 [Ophidiomyces ophidiicola]|uniref:uncharacterized protein n=1 Tax=Ophidiomyces ophidiicola TaxID=1387563 RepID=UPI0020C3165A|nr:uncharacterized protein LOZ57_005392 [Ophidiomyces ophidiicola]KAI1942169.1 hypothetical protein LOZ57_005392 [Ophidiomyces ophidiicola]KAI2062290.1 hypothetical protein LOZ43_000618 [Ophidiomyces ophidiicola]KAI2091741.1 hypothetical protein LOZ36_000829 [Ophidiomyces ophidiicola]
MASPAHCYYCFECISASFKGEEAPNLQVIEALWEEYEAYKSLVSRSAQDEEEWEGLAGRQEDQVKKADAPRRDCDEVSLHSKQPENLSGPADSRLPSISRLRGILSPRSSNASTPSTLSSTSSSHSTTSSMTSQSIDSPPLSLQQKSYGSICRNVTNLEYPLFVTWNVIGRDGHKQLRGCIGTFEPQDLSSGLQSYSLSSAFGDTRFSPIPASLLPSLSCSLTLLSSFEVCSHAMDWVLGTHGIRISFTHNGKRYGATYLPDVPVEQCWTKEETVESLMRKAGWDGRPVHGSVARRFPKSGLNDTQRPRKPWEEVEDFKTVRYQGLKANATYSQWQEWRKWVSLLGDRDAILERAT